MGATATIQTYYRLTKPGIIYGNAITAIGGYLLASAFHIDAGQFLGMLAGLSLVIASGCVYNNYIDQDIDRVMARTKKRALVNGSVSGANALAYATVLGLLGFLSLGLYTNPVTLYSAMFGLFAYVVLYSIGKRKSVHGTVIGSLSGAVPPVVGYCAVTGSVDTAAVLLFLIMVCWQMPHFYAIAMYRKQDYAAAGLPVLPVKKSMAAAKRYILAYIAAFLAAASLLTVFGYTGYTYLVVMALASGYWLGLGLRVMQPPDNIRWARKMFGFSLLILLVWAAMLAAGPFLP